MSDQQKPTKKLVLLASILAAGLLAAVFAASQLTASATAQSEDDQMTGTEPTTGTEEQTQSTEEQPVDAELISASIEDSDKSTLSVTGTATTKTQPDKFSVTLEIETNATTAAEAASNNAEQVNATIAAFTDLGIAEEQMATTSYNLFPVYSDVQKDEACIEVFPPPPGCEPSQEITGYRTSSSLTVTLDTEGDVDAGTVIDTAIGAGANNVSGVFFFVSSEKQQEIRDGLIADAIADARHKADVAAAALEMQVSGIHSVGLADVQFPIFARGAEVLQADASTQILPGEQEVTSTVSITYIISAGASADTGEETGGTEAEIQEGVGVESETETEGGSAEGTGTTGT